MTVSRLLRMLLLLAVGCGWRGAEVCADALYDRAADPLAALQSESRQTGYRRPTPGGGSFTPQSRRPPVSSGPSSAPFRKPSLSKPTRPSNPASLLRIGPTQPQNPNQAAAMNLTAGILNLVAAGINASAGGNAGSGVGGGNLEDPPADAPEDPPVAADGSTGDADERPAEPDAQEVPPDAADSPAGEIAILEQESRGGAAAAAGLPAELQDPAFDRYVDWNTFGTALAALDPVGVADVALQLAEGERILLRSHKATSADAALKMAIRLATDQQDKATLARLAQFARQQGNKQLAEQIAVSERLSGQARAAESGLMLSPADVTAEEFAWLQSLLRRIKQGAILGDRAALLETEQLLEQSQNLRQEHVQYLRKVLQRARESLPETKSGAENIGLGKLSAASRGGLFSGTPVDNTPLDPDTWRPGSGGQEDSGSSVQVVTSPSIDNNGNVWSGSGSSGGGNRIVGKATLKRDSSGRAYWVSNYSNIYGRPQPVRATKYDGIGDDNAEQVRSVYTINSDGGVYRHRTYVGQARHVRFNSGKTGWFHQVDARTGAYRLDNDNQTRITHK